MPQANRLAKPQSALKPHYDVVIVGSGYGGGVAASRLARAGKRVAVLERGREVLTGEFPARFPDMHANMQVTGKSMRIGSETALFDVRLGDDMHVLVGCGLGGGSLVNAGVALRPDPRVFADPVWPGQIRQDGLLDESYARARRWLRPVSDPAAATLTKYKALERVSSALGKSPVAATFQGGATVATKAAEATLAPSMNQIEVLPAPSRNSLVITPAVVMRPILLPPSSVNHSAPSGPTVMSLG